MSDRMDGRMSRTEQIMENARTCGKALLTSRIEMSLERAQKDPQYKELCYKWETEEKDIEQILKKLNRKERIVIRRHQEELITKENYELEEVYMQGMKDCIQLLSYLGMFSQEKCIRDVML